MTDPSSYRRTALPLRPWIAGKLYDDLSRSSILHCDAYVFVFGGNKYLQLDWRIGGTVPLALDTWLISDALMPVWDIHRSRGALVYETSGALHMRVVMQAREASRATFGVQRVSLLCHYIDARETDCELAANGYVERKPYAPRVYKGKLPDVL